MAYQDILEPNLIDAEDYTDLCRVPFGRVAAFSIGQPS